MRGLKLIKKCPITAVEQSYLQEYAMSIPALQSGIVGIQKGFDNLRKDANAIAQAGVKPETEAADLAEPLTNLKMDSLQVAASTKVVETVHDLLGQLLDVKA